MQMKRMATPLLVFAVITVLVVLAFRVRIGVTADSVVILKTTGMTCGSCSSTITSSLEKLPGVAATEVDVEGGWVVVGYDTKALKPEALAEKVSGAGFRSMVHRVLTPDQFRQMTGRDFGRKAASSGGCGGCGTTGGCGSDRKS